MNTAQHTSVWDAITETPEEAAKMKALSEAKIWFDAMAENHPEPLTMNAQTGGALITGHISRINMAMLFAICRGNGVDTEPLEKICAKHNQPIPAP